jgi:hypothetical protein
VLEGQAGSAGWIEEEHAADAFVGKRVPQLARRKRLEEAKR